MSRPAARRAVPELRLVLANRKPVRTDGTHVLYWMTSARRTGWNFGLQRAIEWSRDLDKPLVVLEGIRIGYAWASDRFHRFAIDGMQDNSAAFRKAGVTYLPYVEPTDGAGKGLVEALSDQACLVVTDDFPAFFLPRMVAAAASKVSVRMERVDSNGLYPLAAADREFTRAFSLRLHLQKVLPDFLTDDQRPLPDPLAGYEKPLFPLPATLTKRWPAATDALLQGDAKALAALPIDHTVTTVERGGPVAGAALLADFVKHRIERYADERSEPESDASSGLSPFLHWGHVSVHQVLDVLAKKEQWSADKLVAGGGAGAKGTWWHMSPAAESFVDELVTWRELGFLQCHRTPDTYDRWESLPAWARASLEKHTEDPRPALYTLEQLERGETYDPLWNAAQMQLVRTGRMHNYLRMLWGKRVIEWTAQPKDALERLVHLNNKYALDGRDPNSYSGIFWVFGRYDRPWGPERPIYGLIRYMSSENTARKFKVKAYVERWAPGKKGVQGRLL